MEKIYKNTLTLPITDFPMRSNLPMLEPKILEFWQTINLYDLLDANPHDKPTFNLHFGPPYANGNFHIGHAFNIILKDFILRSKKFLGYHTTSISGHDCHGQPIEYAILKEKRDFSSVLEFKTQCKEFAEKWITIQQKTLHRLGVLVDPRQYYKTLDMSQDIYTVFSELLLNNLVYMEQKPVPWSIKEKTVISDAEMEYHNKMSTSVDVALQIMDSPVDSLKNQYIVIWTTTPWSLLDNVAVAFHKDINYVFCESEDQIIIVAENTFEQFKLRLDNAALNPLGKISGAVFTGSQCIHPILQHYVPMVHSDHVSATDGTGFVHIAPAHGPEDFLLCKNLKIPLIESIDEAGFYYDNVDKKLANKHIFKDEEHILDVLEGKLLAINKIEHSYPHTARGNTPIIYRASEQIFISLSDIKPKLEIILKDCQFIPSLLKETLITTIRNREEWCVSRQRIWGIPLCLFIHKKTKEILIDFDLQAKILEKINTDPEISINFHKLVDNEDYEPYYGVLDVWFDSGCVSRTLGRYYGKNDSFLTNGLYCEGKDQTRGWFQSSLLCAYLSEEKVPYSEVITHGFIVDEQGYKMSKSKGNGVNLEDELKLRGSEILRLCIATSDYTGDVKLGQNLLNNAGDTYRKIRNVIRYLISILETSEIPNKVNFTYLDRVVLNKLNIVNINIQKYLKEYSFKKAFDEIFSYIQYISGIYFNAKKDCLYCDDKTSNKKQSTIKTMQIILKSLNIMLSTFLPFSSEEIFQYCKEKNIFISQNKSIHLYTFKEIKIPQFNNEHEIFNKIDLQLNEFRITIDELKQSGKITRNTDLFIEFKYDFSQENISEEVVKDILGVSKVIKSDINNKVHISNLDNCQRCWQRLGKICLRCQHIVKK